MKMTIAFNTCGISGREIYHKYINSIRGILNQKFDDFRVVLSSCLNSHEVRSILFREFGSKISYCFMDEKLPVNITFNKAVQKMTETFGESETYLYVDSGVDISNDLDSLSKLYELHKSGPYGMTTSKADCDAGYWLWFGENVPGWSPHHSPSPQQDEECSRQMFLNGHFEIPVGKTVNLHFQLFDNSIYQNFNQKLMPDIFASHSTEGTFTFINSSLNRKFVIHKDVKVSHLTSMDGGSSGFRPEYAGVPGYQHTIHFSKKKIMDGVNSQEAKECGFGYEECQSILMHDKSKFDENGYSKDPERLKSFLINNFYLSEEELNYKNINCNFIK